MLKNWLLEMEGSSQVSVAITMSGLTLSSIFSTLSCFFLIEWQLRFKTLIDDADCFCAFLRFGVEELTGLNCLAGSGLGS